MFTKLDRVLRALELKRVVIAVVFKHFIGVVVCRYVTNNFKTLVVEIS